MGAGVGQPELLGGRIVILLSELMRDRTEFIGTPTELSAQIDPVGSEGMRVLNLISFFMFFSNRS